MTALPEHAQAAAEIAVEDALDGYLGYRLNAATCGEVVRAVVDALAGEGLILVRRDDVHALVRDEFPSFHDYATAQVRLRAALGDKETPHA